LSIPLRKKGENELSGIGYGEKKTWPSELLGGKGKKGTSGRIRGEERQKQYKGGTKLMEKAALIVSATGRCRSPH